MAVVIPLPTASTQVIHNDTKHSNEYSMDMLRLAYKRAMKSRTKDRAKAKS